MFILGCIYRYGMQLKFNKEKIDEAKEALREKIAYLSWQDIDMLAGKVLSINPSKFNPDNTYLVLDVYGFESVNREKYEERLRETENKGAISVTASMGNIEVGSEVVLINNGKTKSKSGRPVRVIDIIPLEVAKKTGLITT